MADVQKAEELRLPEQLSIIGTDHQTGEPRVDRVRTERMLALSVLWELHQAGALVLDENLITSVNEVEFHESYLRRAAMLANQNAPIEGRKLAAIIRREMRPIWSAIGVDLVQKGLLEKTEQTKLWVFRKQVHRQTTEGRIANADLAINLIEQVSKLNNPANQWEFTHNYPRLATRIVLLYNFGLLSPIAGPLAYQKAEPHIPWLKQHLNNMIVLASTSNPREAVPDDPTYGPDFSSFFLSDSYTDGDYHTHDRHQDENDEDNDNSDGGDSGGGDSGSGDTGGGGDGGGGGD